MPRHLPGRRRALIVALLISAFAQDPARGEILAGLGGCAACHTADDGPAWAGGHGVVTTVGTFYGSNLTPDPTHGLGGWTFDDFKRAMHEGRNPEGKAYWPAFPYTSFTRMDDRDLTDLWAFLQSLEPLPVADVPHEDASARWKLGVFRWRAFDPGPVPLPEDPVLARGAYLATAIGHCRECHTPRTRIGRLRTDQELEGGHAPFVEAPAIDPEALATWTNDDVDTFLTLGMTPDGDFPGGGMQRIVEQGTARLEPGDRAALVRWLQEGSSPVGQ